jgi:asparagine synthase (glutamine-hydrolysing)
MAAADGVTRMIGGDGGDELFGGNERYARQQVFALYQKVPALLREGLLEPALNHFPGADRVALLRKARSYVAQASVPMPARLETYNLLNRYGAAEVFEPALLAGANTGRPLDELAASYGQSDAGSLINRMLALDLKITLADNDLPKVRGACALAGVEAAFPFLSESMVAFSSRLTPRQKLNGSQLRYFFKQALGDFLPQEIIHKEKHGFGLPFGVWMQQYPCLHALAGDSLQSLRRRGVVRGEFIDKLLGHHVREHAGYHGTMVWVLMMLEQWYQQHQQPQHARD